MTVTVVDDKVRKLHWRGERQRQIVDDGRIRAIACPHCRAKVGESCHSPSWYEVSFHVGRRQLAGVR